MFKFDEKNHLGVTATGKEFVDFKSNFSNDDRGFGYIRIKVKYLSVLKQALIASNLSFIELEKFEFEFMLNSRKINYSGLSLSFETSLPSFSSNISSISRFYGVRISQKYQSSNSNFMSLKFDN